MGQSFLDGLFSKKTGNWFKNAAEKTFKFAKKTGSQAASWVDKQASSFTDLLSNPMFLIVVGVCAVGVIMVIAR